jgi:hypothetical protein
MQQGQNLTVNNASFYTRSTSGIQPLSAVTARLQGSAVINLAMNPETGRGVDEFNASEFSGGSVSSGGDNTSAAYITGGDGLMIDANGSVTVHGGTFIGSQLNGQPHTSMVTGLNTANGTAYAQGGRGAILGGSTVTVHDGYYVGGGAGEATVQGTGGYADAIGGSGLLATSATVNDGTYIAASGGRAESLRGQTIDPSDETISDPSDANSKVNAMGGSGIFLPLAGTSTINVKSATGARGGSAFANDASTVATATGGSGNMGFSHNITINGGNFVAGDGGSAFVGTANAEGGGGARIGGGSLNIKGGKGGKANGVNEMGNVGVWVSEGNLTVSEDSTDTHINGSVVIRNNSNRIANLLAGTITGDLYLQGTATTTLQLSTNMNFHGSFIQSAGTVNVTLNNAQEGTAFSDVELSNGNLNLNGARVTTKEGASFKLGDENSNLAFHSLTLNTNASINAGYGAVSTTSGSLEMKAGSSINLAYDGMADEQGEINMGATTLNMVDPSARINISGAAMMGSNTVTVVNGTAAASLATNENIQADFGWLTRVVDIDTSAGIKVTHDFDSMTNKSSLAGINHSVLTNMDAAIRMMGTTNFYKLNAIGEPAVAELARYSVSQMPDTANTSFQVQNELAGQYAARGTEFRSLNGYASTKPSFLQNAKPQGVAGYNDDDSKNLQGWIRGYGALGDRDATGNYTSYDSTVWGTVVGLDKSFGQLLVGIAGGYAHTEIDGNAYNATADTGHASVYSTIGGESIFVDLAGTYALSRTDEQTGGTDSGNFDSSSFSFYVGGGMRFDATERISITPEVSLLTSYYNQDSWIRSTPLLTGPMMIDSYVAWSYLGSLGLNFATAHQIDWLNQGLALIPELRAHWLHEFNADLDEGRFTISGVPGSLPLFVRPLEEDLLRLGVGFDVWSLKMQNANFEVDYDAILASDYQNHILSGKINLKF